MANILDNFRLSNETESFDTVKARIYQGVDFKGTNLWILVFAIFIASLGLNVNSTAVIIGAMLVSPLMGPIMGIGLALATNDFELLKKSLSNFGLASVISLITSTLYFFITPLNEAHSEILARTAPNIYDVLIALFGGFAGMLANASRLKGNVIPGVAIATALMPPLCTAGYGLATFQFSYMLGALYLFFINTVFIALATYFTSKALRFPVQHLPDRVADRKAKWLIGTVTLCTLLPSIYFGYESVRAAQYMAAANRFIDAEANFQNDYLLRRKIDPENRIIHLTYGGDPLPDSAVENLKRKLPNYQLLNTSVDVQLGFSSTHDERYSQLENTLASLLEQRDREMNRLGLRLDSLMRAPSADSQLLREIKTFLPAVEAFGVQAMPMISDSSSYTRWNARITSLKPLSPVDRRKAEAWLRQRLNRPDLLVDFAAGKGR